MGHAVKRVGHFDLLHNYIRRVDPDPMTARKPGDKTMRFLGKRMRWKEQSNEWTFYRVGKWELGLAEHGTGYICTLGNESIECVTVGPTAEAAILDCEAQALALFKQLGELCGKRGRE